MELQQFFIKIRDELCKNGEIMLSTALNYTFKHLNSDVEQDKREKIPREIEEDKQKTEEEKGGRGGSLDERFASSPSSATLISCPGLLLKDGEKAKSLPQDMETERDYKQDCSFQNHTYHVGEFVYVEPSEPNLKPHIVCIERLWEDEQGETTSFTSLVSVRPF